MATVHPHPSTLSRNQPVYSSHCLLKNSTNPSSPHLHATVWHRVDHPEKFVFGILHFLGSFPLGPSTPHNSLDAGESWSLPAPTNSASPAGTLVSAPACSIGFWRTRCAPQLRPAISNQAHSALGRRQPLTALALIYNTAITPRNA